MIMFRGLFSGVRNLFPNLFYNLDAELVARRSKINGLITEDSIKELDEFVKRMRDYDWDDRYSCSIFKCFIATVFIFFMLRFVVFDNVFYFDHMPCEYFASEFNCIKACAHSSAFSAFAIVAVPTYCLLCRKGGYIKRNLRELEKLEKMIEEQKARISKNKTKGEIEEIEAEIKKVESEIELEQCYWKKSKKVIKLLEHKKSLKRSLEKAKGREPKKLRRKKDSDKDGAFESQDKESDKEEVYSKSKIPGKTSMVSGKTSMVCTLIDGDHDELVEEDETRKEAYSTEYYWKRCKTQRDPDKLVEKLLKEGGAAQKAYAVAQSEQVSKKSKEAQEELSTARYWKRRMEQKRLNVSHRLNKEDMMAQASKYKCKFKSPAKT